MDDTDGVAGLLSDGFDRVRQVVEDTVTGRSPEQLAYAPVPGANSIGWLGWHLTRIPDAQLAEAIGGAHGWTAKGWPDRFARPFDSSATGYGQRPEEVAA